MQAQGLRVKKMYTRILLGMIAIGAVADAQTFPRRATVTGGGNPNNGQCTVEVVVDGAAEVEVRGGGDAVLRNLSGNPPQWRRFECTSIMPANPAGFRFEGVDGRGKQELVRDPRNGGAAVVRIEDPNGGSEGYTFRVMWGGGYTQDRGPGGRDDRGIGSDRGQFGGRDDRGFDRGRPDVDAYHREREGWLRGNDWRATFFQRIRQDLDHATSGAFPFTGDRARLARTQTQLDELQQKLAQGFYDERQLDEVIGSMQVVLQNNRLAGDERAMLTDDLARLRDFRIRHDDYGARNIYGGRNLAGAYPRGRDPRFGGQNRQAMFFQHIREDLEQVAATTPPFGRDQARLAKTKLELDELQQKLSRGFYDERQLDDVTEALQFVVSSNRLNARDRDLLANDLDRLRDFRARHADYGAR
jgi:hypothetical protein